MRPWAGLGALVVAIALQVGVNFANDYSDFVRGADRHRVGPVRAASSGIVDPQSVRSAAIAAFAVAGFAGLALSIAVDVRLLVAGAACLLAGWLYTGGPRPYGYLGLGELFVFVFFGLVATLGTVYVETGRIDALTVWMGCAMGFFASAILGLNNLRDIKTDAAAGKRTLATRIGRENTRVLVAVLHAAAFVVIPIVVLSRIAPAPVALACPAMLIALGPIRAARTETSSRVLVGALKRMAAAELVYALLFAVGMLL